LIIKSKTEFKARTSARSAGGRKVSLSVSESGPPSSVVTLMSKTRAIRLDVHSRDTPTLHTDRHTDTQPADKPNRYQTAG